MIPFRGPRPLARAFLLTALSALSQGCHRPLVVNHDDLLLHASPEPPPQPRTLRPTPAPMAPPLGPTYHPE